MLEPHEDRVPGRQPWTSQPWFNLVVGFAGSLCASLIVWWLTSQQWGGYWHVGAAGVVVGAALIWGLYSFVQTSTLRRDYDLRELRKRGLVRIFVDRQRARDEIAQRIKRYRQLPKLDIWLVGVTLRTELLETAGPDAGLARALTEAAEERAFRLTAYAIDPTAEQALVRAWYERGEPSAEKWGDCTLVRGAQAVIEDLTTEGPSRRWMKHLKSGQLDIRYYSGPPPHSWVLVLECGNDGWAYVEPYHLGEMDPRGPGNEGLCEEMPVFCFEKGAHQGERDLYTAVWSHVQRVGKLVSNSHDPERADFLSDLGQRLEKLSGISLPSFDDADGLRTEVIGRPYADQLEPGDADEG